MAELFYGHVIKDRGQRHPDCSICTAPAPKELIETRERLRNGVGYVKKPS